MWPVRFYVRCCHGALAKPSTLLLHRSGPRYPVQNTADVDTCVLAGAILVCTAQPMQWVQGKADLACLLRPLRLMHLSRTSCACLAVLRRLDVKLSQMLLTDGVFSSAGCLHTDSCLRRSRIQTSIFLYLLRPCWECRWWCQHCY